MDERVLVLLFWGLSLSAAGRPDWSDWHVRQVQSELKQLVLTSIPQERYDDMFRNIVENFDE